MKRNLKIQQTLLISLAMVIGAQISFDLFHTDFKISIGILAFSAALLVFGRYRVLPVTFISAVGVYLSRTILYWMKWSRLDFHIYIPEMVFYLTYGVLFYLYCKKYDFEITIRSTSCLLVIDCLANVVELLFRMASYAFIGWEMFFSIFCVGVLRTLIIVFLLWCLNYYKFSLLKREHAERYQRLLLLISKLNEEVVLMQKNRKLMETTMSTSYKLFQDMGKEDVSPELSKMALNIAKDVHELKKEYTLILRGLSDAMELNTREEGMYIHDIFRVLNHSLRSVIPEGKNVQLDFQYEENLYTEQHYFMLSVFRNLVNNAIEASDKEMAVISVVQKTESGYYKFEVEDNGPGIPEENLDQIFLPGFSTKINFETGEVSRGLGLELVKDLIENQWDGTIDVMSCPGKTVFTICIPKEKWKGEI